MADSGWQPWRMSAPPPESFQRREYSACEPLCDSSPIIMVIREPDFSRISRLFCTDGA
ncbi:hypothetical protein [Agrococcus sp. KRD186]|uniref:hypothetical protein n=1 Tax=Agrococcus sp. KRD186 TaxID=2729730 RepID=UPI001F49B370|nr:hypothetical protein [Agrococcus sp. KRD186]